MNGEACCQDRRAVHPGIVFFRLRQHADLGLFDVPKNSGSRLERFASSYRCACRQPQGARMFEGALR